MTNAFTPRPWARFLAGLLVLGSLTACGGGDDGAPPSASPRPSGMAVVDARGGTAVGEDGARIVVPEGATEEALTISIAQNASQAPALPSGVAPAGSVFELQPHGARFATPVQLRLPFGARVVPSGSRVALAKAELGGAWHLIEDVQVEGDQLVASVRDFSFVIPVFVPVARNLTVTTTEVPEFTLSFVPWPLDPPTTTKHLTGESGLVYRQPLARGQQFRIDTRIPANAPYTAVCGASATLNVYAGPGRRYRLSTDPADAERLGGYRPVREPIASLDLVAGTSQSLTFTASAFDHLFNEDRDPLPPGVASIAPDPVNPVDVTAVSVEVECGNLVMPNVVPRFALAADFSGSTGSFGVRWPRDVVAVALQPARYLAIGFGDLDDRPSWTRVRSDRTLERISNATGTLLPDHTLHTVTKGAFKGYFMTSEVTLAEYDGSTIEVTAAPRSGNQAPTSLGFGVRLTLAGNAPPPRFSVEPADEQKAPGDRSDYYAVFVSTPVPSYATWQTRPNLDAPWVNIFPGSVVAGWKTALDRTGSAFAFNAPNVFKDSATSGHTSLGRATALTIEDDGRQFRVGITNSGGTTYSRIATLRVTTGLVAPSFTVQPADVVAAAGQPARLSFRGTGSQPQSIQWFFNGQPIAGGNYTEIDVAAVNAGNAGEYQVALSNAEGRVLSRAARLTVLGAGSPTPPVITTQPASITVPEGASAGFAVAVSGVTEPAFQWQRDGVNLPGATQASLVIPQVATADAGAYGVVVTANGVSVASAVARLNLGAAAAAPAIVTPPTGLAVNLGQTATLAVAATGSAPLAYQWQRDGTNVAGATGPVLVLTNAQAGDAGNYTVTVRNGSGSVTSAVAGLVVLPVPGAPTITAQPSDTTVLLGGIARLTATVTGNPTPQCQWTRHGTAIAGATDCSGYTTPPVTLDDQGATYNLVAYSAGGVAFGTGARLTVATAVAPNVTTQPASQTVSAGGGTSFSVAASGTPAPSVEWGVNGGLIGTSGRYVLGGCTFDFDAQGGTLTLQNIAEACDGATVVAQARNVAGTALSDVVTLSVRSTAVRATLVSGSLGVRGSVDGPADTARFDTPNYVVRARDGGVVVGDFGNSAIRVVSPTGTVKTLAGTPGVFGFADGTGTDARFNGNGGLAFDSAGNLFVSDWDNHVIRRVTPEGVVTTFAGSPGVPGSADGSGAAARLRNPNGLAIDAADNLYVVDWGNHTVRKITPAGVVSTFAGAAGQTGSADGTGAEARFRTPGAVAIDGAGNLYVTDMFNHTVRKITPAGVVTTLAGQPALSGTVDGTGSNARFDTPAWITATTDGTLFVVSAAGDTIRKVTPAGEVSTVVGVLGENSAVVLGGDPRLRHARGVWAVSPRELYVAADHALLYIILP